MKSVKIHTIVDLSVLERHFRSKVADEYVTKEEKQTGPSIVRSRLGTFLGGSLQLAKLYYWVVADNLPNCRELKRER